MASQSYTGIYKVKGKGVKGTILSHFSRPKVTRPKKTIAKA